MPGPCRPRFALAVAVALLLPALAGAWPHSPAAPLPVNDGAAYGYSTLSVSDGAGGVIVAWQDYRAGLPDVIVQRFDALGREVWTQYGVTLCGAAGAQYPSTMVADGSGGAIVAWDDYRSNPNGDLYVRRVDAAGTPLWAANGVLVNGTPAVKHRPQVASDGSGGCFIAWDDDRNSGTSGTDVYLQRITAAGAAVFTANGLAVCTANGKQSGVQLVVDSDAYPTLVWEDWRAGNADIYGQRCHPGGAALWTAGGVGFCTLATNATTPAIALTATSDLVMAWSDARNGGRNEIYAQFVSAFSALPWWTANGVQVLAAPVNLFLQSLQHDGVGGYVVTAVRQDAGGGQALLAQKFDLLPTPAWGPGAVLRSGSGSPYGVVAAPDGHGGMLFAWQDSRGDGADVYAQRLDTQGGALWRAGGLPVGQAPSYQQSPRLVTGPAGGAYVSFDDSNTGYPSLMAVDEWGFLGAAPVMVDVTDVPNDQGGQVKVSWYASPLDVDPLYRNIAEYVVYRSVPPQQAARLAPLAALAEGGSATVGGRRYLRTRFAAQDYFWEELERVVARHLSGYSAVVVTTGDSVGGSNPLTAFMVGAVGDNGLHHWFTAADSGYSVDDLAPAPPAPFTGTYAGGGVQLHWNPNAEADLAGYRLYRGGSPSFVPGPASLVSAQPDTGYAAVAGAPYVYKLTAVDVHGNESLAATLLPVGTLHAGPTPATFFLSPPSPNPATRGGASVLRFGLARGGRAELGVYDAGGRRVRMLVAGDRPAGEHLATWDGRTDGGGTAAPGLYFVRLVAEGREARQRVARIE